MDFRSRSQNQIFGVRATALIMRGNRLFLSYRKETETYYTIGGAIEVGESTEEAVSREVKEELGIDVTVKQLAFIVENEFTVLDNRKPLHFHNIEFHYIVEFSGEMPSHMIEEKWAYPCYWIDVDNLVNVNVVPSFLKNHLPNWSGTMEHIRLKEKK
ncbi:NUDIX hydrolase [Streptococcus himalayensis]|uniref:NUDIX hydrolase n=1 Tax=Streptococcus himalayensis TaxID=1888195 RepID=A0A917A2V4_9STRE|nr:NUDIX domain-containing protein [Streptococcus himalayensis]GGE23788.1 NUDIX hydrolase [Streptococcus himalayensis]